MAGTLALDTIQDGSGNSTSASNVVFGSARAWVNFNGSNGTIRGSYNVSSVTRVVTGAYTIAMTNAIPNINCCGVASASTDSGNTSAVVSIFANQGTAEAPTTTSFKISCYARPSGSGLDPVYGCAAIFD